MQPRRSDGNRRLYSMEDLELLEYVHYMTHVRKVNLPGVKAILDLLDKLPAEIRQREMSSVERAIDGLDGTTKEIFSKGSATVENSLLDESSAKDIQRRAETEVKLEESEFATARAASGNDKVLPLVDSAKKKK